MRPLSSSAAIGPAFRRMRALLFQPFDWGTFLRVSLAAVIAESMVVSFRYVTPHLELGELPAIPAAFRQVWGFWILVGIAGLVGLDLVLLAWYGMVRLRFTLFHAVVDESRGLGDGWRRSAKAADGLFRATLLITLGIVGLVGALAAAIAVGVFGVATLKTPDGKLDAGVFLIFFFPIIGFVAAIVAAGLLARVVLHDFILPHMALENKTFREAWQEVRRRVRADREGFFSYLLLRALFAILAAPLLAILGFLMLWPVFWALGASAAGYNALMDEATGVWGAVQMGLNVILLVLGGAAGVAGAAIFGGPLAVFLRAHAIYFYGSRYKALGELLTEPAAVTAETGGA